MSAMREGRFAIASGSARSGALFVAGAAFLWSGGGLFVRMAGLDAWTTTFWRSLFALLSLLVVAFMQHGRATPLKLARIGAQGCVSAALTTTSTIAYIFALRLTTVANVMTVYAAMPFLVTIVAYFWLGERVSKRFIGAGLIAMAGISIMVGGASSVRDIQGLAMSLLMTLTFALLLVHARRYPGVDMTVANVFTNLFCVLVAFPFARHGLPSPHGLMACALFGVFSSGVAYTLFLVGGRLIPSAEAALLSLLDVALGPLWVWLIYDERPDRQVLTGGGLVVGAVVFHLVGKLPRGKRQEVENSEKPRKI